MDSTKHPIQVKTVSAWDFTGYSEESLEDAIRILNKAKGTNRTLPGPLNKILAAFHKALEHKRPGVQYQDVDQEPIHPMDWFGGLKKP